MKPPIDPCSRCPFAWMDLALRNQCQTVEFLSAYFWTRIRSSRLTNSLLDKRVKIDWSFSLVFVVSIRRKFVNEMLATQENLSTKLLIPIQILIFKCQRLQNVEQMFYSILTKDYSLLLQIEDWLPMPQHQSAGSLRSPRAVTGVDFNTQMSSAVKRFFDEWWEPSLEGLIQCRYGLLPPMALTSNATIQPSHSWRNRWRQRH